MTPEDYAGLARFLLDAGADREAHRRGAAHAAYYAAYHMTARRLGLDPRNRKDARHDRLIARLREEPWPDATPFLKQARTALPVLHAMRTRADYDLAAVFPAEEAAFAVALVESLVGADLP